MSKMKTLKHIRVGELDLRNGGDVARIERNLFARENGDTFEALRFCKQRNGRHNRVHLVIGEEEFVRLFANAVEQGVFESQSLRKLTQILRSRPRRKKMTDGGSRFRDPFLKVIGIFRDGHLAEGIDEELYGKDSL